jgi:hypothetical protein
MFRVRATPRRNTDDAVDFQTSTSTSVSCDTATRKVRPAGTNTR